MNNENTILLRVAFTKYLAIPNEALEPFDEYLPYHFENIEKINRGIGGEMVKDELQELTNLLNSWQGGLKRWDAWNQVINPQEDAYSEEEAWILRLEFLDALAHQCLCQPSSMRDTITFVATNSVHQLRLAIGNGYVDSLEGDPKTAEKPKHLSRRRKELRLETLLQPCDESSAFMEALRSIDGPKYKATTSDYRNRSSHAIAPRFGIGITRAVVRSVVPATQMVKQADGTFISKEVPDKMCVQYALGGTAPLDMVAARKANLEQYFYARQCYLQYLNLLNIGVGSIHISDM